MKRHDIIMLAAAAAAALIFTGCGNASAAGGTTTASSAAADDLAPDTATSAYATTEKISEPVIRSQMLDCMYYVDRDFHFFDEESVIYDTDGRVMCGIAPHHLTAGKLIAGMYRTAAEAGGNIDTVVLIAPQHYETESAGVLVTSRKSWNTAFGIAENDTEITDMLINRLGAAEDDYMIEFDHSASSHIPFIHRYLPDAKVSCLLVSPKAAGNMPEKLSELLHEISRKKNCFFAFSIDFSHYLDPDDADMHDRETLEAVLAGRTDEIERFTNSNVDTPYCLSTFVRLSNKLGGHIAAADNSNTWRIGYLPYSRTLFPDGVTSYFVFFSAAD